MAIARTLHASVLESWTTNLGIRSTYEVLIIQVAFLIPKITENMGQNPEHGRLDFVGQSTYEIQVMVCVQNMVGFFCHAHGYWYLVFGIW